MLFDLKIVIWSWIYCQWLMQSFVFGSRRCVVIFGLRFSPRESGINEVRHIDVYVEAIFKYANVHLLIICGAVC